MVYFAKKEPTIDIFNINSGMTMTEFLESKYYNALMSGKFRLTDNESGYLKTYTYKEACENWWKSLTDENKDFEITGERI